MSYYNQPYGQGGYGQRPQQGPPPGYGQRPQQGQPPGYGQRPQQAMPTMPNVAPQNPFNDQPRPSYGQNPYSDSAAASVSDLEMGNMKPPQADNPQAILDECSRISDGTAQIDKLLSQLEGAQIRALNDTVSDQNSPTVRQINSLNAEIMSTYKGLINRMKWIKSRPASGSAMNQKQIGLVDRKLKGTYQRYLQVENEYEKRMKEQMARQYRITKPDASDDEVRQACEDPSQQVFSQALLRSDRRGESRQVLSAVRERHEAIQKIERQMEQLAQMFQDMDRMVIEQEPLVQQIEQKTEETHVHVVQANEQLTQANVSARAARKKKWCCFWISIILLIIVIIIIAIVVWYFVAGPAAQVANANKNNH